MQASRGPMGRKTSELPPFGVLSLIVLVRASMLMNNDGAG
jgi:hypothetical protein